MSEIKMSIKKLGKDVKQMNKYLMNRSDEKLIQGYKNAIKDYEATGDEKCKVAGELIKQEIDRRGLKV